MMKTMFEALQDSWHELLRAGGSRQRLLEQHPLRIFYGADDSSRPVLVLISTAKPPILQLSGAVDVKLGARGDGTWATVVTLLSDSMVDTFLGLCSELARRSSAGETPAAALDLFFETLRQWRELLERDTRRLSKEGLRGLIAELSFATNELATQYSAGEILSAWRGPYGAPQDFVVPAIGLVEVKAVHVGARTVLISSVDQLDPAGGEPLALVLIALSECEASDQDAVTLASLLEKFRALPNFSVAHREQLAHRLSSLGVDESDALYSEQNFLVGGTSYFDVREGFPRIRRADVPPSLDRVEYRARLSGMRDFEVDVNAGSLWMPVKESKGK